MFLKRCSSFEVSVSFALCDLPTMQQSQTSALLRLCWNSTDRFLRCEVHISAFPMSTLMSDKGLRSYTSAKLQCRECTTTSSHDDSTHAASHGRWGWNARGGSSATCAREVFTVRWPPTFVGLFLDLQTSSRHEAILPHGRPPPMLGTRCCPTLLVCHIVQDFDEGIASHLRPHSSPQVSE